jgi:hypothetical protein
MKKKAPDAKGELALYKLETNEERRPSFYVIPSSTFTFRLKMAKSYSRDIDAWIYRV